jgi:hypothetical protein
MTRPEDQARELIDQRLQQAGWLVQDMVQFNPAAIFCGQDVKASVGVFDAHPGHRPVQAKGVWFYDLRTNKHFTMKTRQLAFDAWKISWSAYGPRTGTSVSGASDSASTTATSCLSGARLARMCLAHG